MWTVTEHLRQFFGLAASSLHKPGWHAFAFGRVRPTSSMRDAFRMKHRHRIPEWNSKGLVIDTWRTAPDSPSGQTFLQHLDTDSLHKIAAGLNLQSPTALSWLKALAAHPACDKATAWLLFLRAKPTRYEDVIRRAGARPQFQLDDAEIVSLLDIIHTRLVAHDFTTNELALHNASDVRRFRRWHSNAKARGRRLHWEMPDYAFSLSTGRQALSRFDLWEAEKIMMPFAEWVVSHPEEQGGQCAKVQVQNE